MSKYDAPHYSFIFGTTRNGQILLLTVHSKGINFDKKKEEWYLKAVIVDNPYNYKKSIPIGPIWEIEKGFTEDEYTFDSFEEAYDKLFEIAEKHNLEKVL